ncbi:MAG: Eco57I restriction-modification methylase domain-containing protein [Candidatus Hodarchaeota archaeon]
MNLHQEKDIEYFFSLYKRSQSFLINNSRGFSSIDKKKKFIESLMNQLFVLWCLQEHGFFDGDRSYFLTKFNEIKQRTHSNSFNNYYDFIKYFLKKAKLRSHQGYYEDKQLGRIVLLGPVIFMNLDSNFDNISIPDYCFYQMNQTVNLNAKKKKDRKFPFFNILKSQRWTKNSLDEFILGAIYEKLIIQTQRKRSGAYYTPEKVTSYTCKKTIESYLIERIKRKFNIKFQTLDKIFRTQRQEILFYLFDELTSLKILDPAVGVGHFLMSTVKFLLEIYTKLWKTAKSLALSEYMKITILNKNGNKTSINLLDINEIRQVKLFITFYIILPKNVFGVDIDREAIQVAKARLVIFMAKFLEISNSHPIHLQDVYFNIRIGNSLLGYIQSEYRLTSEPLKLDRFFVTKKKTSLNTLSFKDSNLEEYVRHASISLNLDITALKRINELNLLLDSKELNRKDFKNVLLAIHYLSEIIPLSTDPKQKNRMLDLLKAMTRSISWRLDENISSEYDIPLEQLKKLGTFHWFCEFPSVFMEKGGFDIIIANPPYLGESGNKELFRTFAKALPSYYEGKMDLWYLFLHRSIDLMIEGAYSSIICPNYWITATGALKLRTRLMNDTFLVEYINFNENKVFSNAQGIHTNIITFRKSKSSNDSIKCTHFNITYPQGTDLFTILSKQLQFKANQQKLVFKSWDPYFHFLPFETRIIIEFIIKNSEMLRKSGFYVKEGIITGLNSIKNGIIKKYDLKDELKGAGVFILDENNFQDMKVIKSFSKEEKEFLKPFYKSSDINRFSFDIYTTKKILYLNRNITDLEKLPNVKSHLERFTKVLYQSLNNPPYINRPRAREIFISPKIVTPQRSSQNSFTYISNEWYAAQDVYYILNVENDPQNLKILLLILNSKLAYYWLNWMGKKKGKQLELFGEPLSYFPVPFDLDRFILVSILTDYILFLNSVGTTDQLLLNIKNFLEKEIADSLVFELYFKNKFYEDKLYSSNNFILQDKVLENLTPIEYDIWAHLNYTEKIGNGLNKQEEKMRSNLKEEFLKVIKSCHKSLNNNPQIHKYIAKIKSHPWVKKMDGEKSLKRMP